MHRLVARIWWLLLRNCGVPFHLEPWMECASVPTHPTRGFPQLRSRWRYFASYYLPPDSLNGTNQRRTQNKILLAGMAILTMWLRQHQLVLYRRSEENRQ